ncbi:glycosyltransferase family 2 protein [Pseudonocardia alni]|uniref:glycosyltransferase family 2 protein n=1 Tax=Pseudonocardia alni TaxID=33907 RepID=UPI0027A48B39|nr:glycosyltransferase family 2 protein [Pseudonocardia alni]
MIEISAIVLAKNEERCIDRCIRSLDRSIFDQIIVVDTGSTDSTARIVEQYVSPRVRLVNQLWPGGFGRARNMAMSLVQRGWVFFVDADECLVANQGEELVNLLEGLQADEDAVNVVVSPWIVDSSGYESPAPGRILLAQGNIAYFGSVHEEPRVKDSTLGTIRSVVSSIRLTHDGYTVEVVQQKNKLQRNSELLHHCLEEEPNHPRWLYEQFRETLWTDPVDLLERRCLRICQGGNGGVAQNLSAESSWYYFLALRDLARRAVRDGEASRIAQSAKRLESLNPSSPDAVYFHFLAIVYPYLWVSGTPSAGSLESFKDLMTHLNQLIKLRRSEMQFEAHSLHPQGANIDALICAYLEVVGMSRRAEEYRSAIAGSWSEPPFEANSIISR